MTHGEQSFDAELARPVDLGRLVDYQPGGIVSRALVQKSTGTVTLFAFDAGQQLSEHTAPFDAMVQAVEGTVELTIGGAIVHVPAGQTVVMPAGAPHSVRAVERFKMLLTMIRS